MGQTGAIYRIAPKGQPTYPFPVLIVTPLPDRLRHSKILLPMFVRLGRSRLERAGKKAIPAVQQLLSHSNEFIQGRAIWLLAKLGCRRSEESSNLNLIIRTQGSEFVHSVPFVTKTTGCWNMQANWPRILRPLVRREVALAMRYVPFEKARDILLEIARGYDGQGSLLC